MNCKIPFTKDILFEKKVSEITSISLEHDLTTNDNLLKGNFIISGDFKSHEVSVNKEPFSFILPFEIELANDIDENTIEFMIDDFTYEVLEQSTLRIKIDFNILAGKKDIQEEKDPLFQDAKNAFKENLRELEDEAENLIIPISKEEEIKKEINTINEELKEIEKKEDTKKEEIEKKEDTKKEEIVKKKVENEKEELLVKEEQVEQELISSKNRKIEDQREEKGEKIMKTSIKENVVESETKKESISEETVINSINNADDEYTTYHIHMVSDGETVETICTMYNTNINILGEYNDLSNLTSKDKIIIPGTNE